MTLETALARAGDVAARVLAPSAGKNDKEGRFSTEAVAALGESGLLGLTVATEHGGMGLGPRSLFEVTAVLSQADASVGMVFTMHVCAVACMAASVHPGATAPVLRDVARGAHLSTLAFSERGSRSHFWAPISRAGRSGAGARLNAQKSWVTSASAADSYVVSSLAAEGKAPTDSTLYFVPRNSAGVRVAAPWDGMGLRANDSAPVLLEGCEVPEQHRLTEEGGGFKAMLETVLPLFNVGSAAVALGLCRAAVGATATHLKTAQFEHLGASLGESLPTLRALLAGMQVDTDSLAALMEDTVGRLEHPDERTQLRVLESKIAAGETAIRVTSAAMRACGGAAFSRHTSIERLFRDAHAGAVMAPTVDVLRDLLGKALLGLPLF
jgi:alkylation response protein AidB-like acyl-CoA dehydrogenase